MGKGPGLLELNGGFDPLAGVAGVLKALLGRLLVGVWVGVAAVDKQSLSASRTVASAKSSVGQDSNTTVAMAAKVEGQRLCSKFSE